MTDLLYETAREYAIHGNRKDVAKCMGCSKEAVRARTCRIRAKTGAQTMIEWFYDEGWLVPGRPR